MPLRHPCGCREALLHLSDPPPLQGGGSLKRSKAPTFVEGDNEITFNNMLGSHLSGHSPAEAKPKGKAGGAAKGTPVPSEAEDDDDDDEQ